MCEYSSKARMPAFQAGNAGSSPATRTKNYENEHLLVFDFGHVRPVHSLYQKRRICNILIIFN